MGTLEDRVTIKSLKKENARLKESFGKIVETFRRCDNEMNDKTQGAEELVAKLWIHIQFAKRYLFGFGGDGPLPVISKEDRKAIDLYIEDRLRRCKTKLVEG